MFRSVSQVLPVFQADSAHDGGGRGKSLRMFGDVRFREIRNLQEARRTGKFRYKNVYMYLHNKQKPNDTVAFIFRLYTIYIHTYLCMYRM